MAENKTRQLVINIEDTLYEAFVEHSRRKGFSTSSLGRTLVVKHLIAEEVLTEEAVLKLLL